MEELQIAGAKVAVAQHSETEPLGDVVWSSVREQNIPYDEFDRLCDQEQVPMDLRPEHTRPSAAFKRAVRDVGSREYLVDYETIQDANGAKKRNPHRMLIVRRVHDQATDALPVVATAEFDPKSLYIYVTGATSTPMPEWRVLEDRIEAAYHMYRDSFAADDIREMIAAAEKKAWAMRLRESGGIYFVPRDHRAPVEAVARVVDKLPGCEMTALPVIDRESERATLLKRYEKATLERLGEVMLQVKALVDKKEEIVPSVFARFMDELAYLKEQKGKYEELLSATMGKVDVEWQAVQQYALQLSNLVKQKAP